MTIYQHRYAITKCDNILKKRELTFMSYCQETMVKKKTLVEVNASLFMVINNTGTKLFLRERLINWKLES